MLGPAATVAAFAASVVLVACAPGPAVSTPAPGTQPPGSIRITMTDYKFVPETVTAASGRAVLYLVNAGTTGHDLTLLGLDGKQLARSQFVSPGASSSLALDRLPAGRYRFFCGQPGHEDLGMVGALEMT